MTKYKLLRDYPPYQKGDIIQLNRMKTDYVCASYDVADRVGIPLSVIDVYPDWFEKVEKLPKLVTEEGDELYDDDKCYFIYDNAYHSSATFSNYKGDCAKDPNAKYFSSLLNAQNYLAELAARRVGIEEGTDLFSKDGLYLGEACEIQHSEVYDFRIVIEKDEASFIFRPYFVFTLTEFAKKEGIELGSSFSNSLITSWVDHYGILSGAIRFAETTHVIKSFIICNRRPMMVTESGRWFRMQGFKKYKEACDSIKGRKIYLAIPYSGMEESSFHTVNEVAAELLRRGAIVYSPISQGHSIIQENPLPASREFWANIEESMMPWCDELLIVQPDVFGGAELIEYSEGCQAEIALAKKLGKEIGYYIH